jgi:type VI protein secretion system component Hcp
MKSWILIAALTLLPLTAALAADPGAKSASGGLVPAVKPAGTLAIDGVRGDRSDGQMDVLTISGNCEPAAAAAASPRDAATGQTSGKRMHKPFVITKEVDKASPLLAQAAASGKKIPKVKVKQEYMTFELKDVIVTSYKTSGGGSGKAPTESFTLNFASCAKG